MMSMTVISRSLCFRAAIRPLSIRILKYSNMSLPRPPITCVMKSKMDLLDLEIRLLKPNLVLIYFNHEVMNLTSTNS